MNTQISLLPVTSKLVPEDLLLAFIERLFGMALPLQLETVVYGITDRMSDGYDGGYWNVYTLSSGGFYMSSSDDRIFDVKCRCSHTEHLAAVALGITVCLYDYSNLSFSLSDIAGDYARQFSTITGVRPVQWQSGEAVAGFSSGASLALPRIQPGAARDRDTDAPLWARVATATFM
jgi:hypothetical protein